MYIAAIFNWCATRICKTCNTWLKSGAWTSFPLDRQIRKWQQPHNSSHPMWMNQNHSYFFVRSAKKILHFLVCQRTLVISLCVPRDEKGWKSLVYRQEGRYKEKAKRIQNTKHAGTKVYLCREAQDQGGGARNLGLYHYCQNYNIHTCISIHRQCK